MVQASLRQPCPDLQPLADSTGATLLRWALASVRDYRICKDRHAALVDAIGLPAEKKQDDRAAQKKQPAQGGL